jgi:replicative DNA helicase
LRLTSSDFYDPRHEVIFAALEQCVVKQQQIDVLVVNDELHRTDPLALQSIGGLPFLSALFINPHADWGRLPSHADIVRSLAAERRFLVGVGELAVAPADERPPLLDGLRQTMARGHGTRKSWDERVAMCEREDALPVLSTGHPDLDAVLGGGLRCTQSYWIVSATKVGKSALALEIALRQTCPVLYWLRDTPTEAMFENRLVARMLDVRVPQWPDRFSRAQREDARPDIEHIQVTKTLSWTDIEADLDHYHRSGNGALFVVDTLQNLPSPDGKEREARAHIDRILAELDRLGQEYTVPILGISTTARPANELIDADPSGAPEKYQALAKESGKIEYDSGAVLAVIRGTDPSARYLAVAANRFGDTAFLRATWIGPIMAWSTFEKWAPLEPGIARDDDVVAYLFEHGASYKSAIAKDLKLGKARGRGIDAITHRLIEAGVVQETRGKRIDLTLDARFQLEASERAL